MRHATRCRGRRSPGSGAAPAEPSPGTRLTSTKGACGRVIIRCACQRALSDALARSSDRYRANDDENTERQDPGIGAEPSRLQLRADPTNEARQIPGAVHAHAVDQPDVDAPPEQAARGADHGPNDRLVVDLVDVVLVGEHALE